MDTGVYRPGGPVNSLRILTETADIFGHLVRIFIKSLSITVRKYIKEYEKYKSSIKKWFAVFYIR